LAVGEPDSLVEDDAVGGIAFDERREEDLLAEAKVFAKYGLQEKARDRLSELFQMRPDHLQGLELQTRIDLEAGQFSEVMANANLVARIASDRGETPLWSDLRTALTKAGFTIEKERVVGEPGAQPAEEDRIAQLLDDLSLDEFDAPVGQGSGQFPVLGSQAGDVVEAASEPEPLEIAAPEAELELPEATVSEAQPLEPVPVEPEPIVAEPAGPESIELELAELVEPKPVASVEPEPDAAEPELAEPVAPESEVAEPELATIAESQPESSPPAAESPAPPEPEASEPAAPEPVSPVSAGKLVSLVDELELSDLQDPLDEPEAVPAGADSGALQAIDPLDETGTSWLDDLETEGPAATSDEETIFDEEDDFFDLAAELERELSEDEGDGAGLMQSQEQSLEDIIEGFKQGVAENLSAEDYDTHFNLGIAYREMGLLDEAIGEFQLAAKDERYVVDSSSLLGICFLEKGLPELAVRSYRKGLESPSISEEATLGLLYDMGSAYQTLGDSDAAYKTFVEVYGLNSHYRDVTEKLEELKAAQG
ncbi:MAG: hypothetical protein AAF657_25335, partial [Acidobacteriota bacterium]